VYNWLTLLYNRDWYNIVNQVSDQIRSVAQSCPTLCDPMNCNTPGLPVHHQLPEFTQTLSIESVIPSSHLILCPPLLLLPPIPPSIRVFSNESTLRMRWPKYCSFRKNLKAQGGEGVEMDWKFEGGGCELFHLEWVNKVLLYTTGNYIQSPEISHHGKEYF